MAQKCVNNVVFIEGEIDKDKKSILVIAPKDTEHFAVKWSSKILSDFRANGYQIIAYAGICSNIYSPIQFDAIIRVNVREYREDGTTKIRDAYRNKSRSMNSTEYSDDMFLGLENYLPRDMEVHYLNSGLFILPTQSFNRNIKDSENNFHHYNGNDSSVIDLVNDIITNAYDKIHRLYSLTGFLYVYKHFHISFAHWISRRYSKNIGWIVDPSVFLSWIPDIRINYIVDDKRGVRNLHSSQIAKNVYDYCKSIPDKYDFDSDGECDFVLGARFCDKRSLEYNKYVKDLRGNISLYIPTGYALRTIKGVNINGIENHPNRKEPIEYDDLIRKLRKARFTLVVSPYTHFDSHNLRLYEALATDTIPLITEEYDPDCLQISNDYKKIFTVRDHLDIMNWFELTNYEHKKYLELAKKLFNEKNSISQNWQVS